MRHKIVFLDRDSLIANVRRPAFEYEWEEYAATAPDEVLAHMQGATIAISNKVMLNAATLSQLPELKMIAVAATGTNNVDLDYCRTHGISVSNIRNYAVHAVPEHVFSMVLALRRNLLAYRDDLQKGLWQKAEQFCLFTHLVNDLHGSTMGLIGYGALGQAVAQLAAAFGMEVLIAEHKGVEQIRSGYTPFDEVIQQSDVISLHSPLTDATRNLIGKREFSLMKPSAILVNTARGGLVEEVALLEALQSGKIAGAGFDVLVNEPPREGNALLNNALPNFILTPHVAWASREAMQILANQLIDNIEAFALGTPQNVVV